jgi:hypothetical protein
MAMQQAATMAPAAQLFGSGAEPMQIGAMAQQHQGQVDMTGKACYFCGDKTHLKNTCTLWAKAKAELAPQQQRNYQPRQQQQQQQQHQPARGQWRGGRGNRGGNRGGQRYQRHGQNDSNDRRAVNAMSNGEDQGPEDQDGGQEEETDHDQQDF